MTQAFYMNQVAHCLGFPDKSDKPENPMTLVKDNKALWSGNFNDENSSKNIFKHLSTRIGSFELYFYDKDGNFKSKETF